MHSTLRIVSVFVVGLLSIRCEAVAQWTANQVEVHGMFGQRALGQTLKPGSSRMLDGLQRGPSGNFFGRDRPEGGMTFGLTGQRALQLQYRDAAATRLSYGAPHHVGPSEIVPMAPRPAPRVTEAGAFPPAESVPLPEAPEPPTPPEVQPQGPPSPAPPPDIWFRSGAAAPNSRPGDGLLRTPRWPSAHGTAPTPLPPRLQIGFAVARSGRSLGAVLTEQVERCPRIQKLSPIAVVVDGETAVLRGRVATEDDRALAEELARLEPGIWQVRNELTVGGPPGPSLVSQADR